MTKDDIELEKFEGCLLGLALGDALGAPFEGGPLERFLWRLIGRTRQGEMRWTDDTQMSLDLAESLIARGNIDTDDLARRFARNYRWSRGYGPGAAKILKRIARGRDWREASRSVYPEGSYGNGGAMRAPVVGLFYAYRPDELIEAAQRSARITHAHPLGIEGAVLIAAVTARALNSNYPLELFDADTVSGASTPYSERLLIARNWLDSGVEPSASEVRLRLGNGIAAIESTVTVLYIALWFLDKPFNEMLAFVRACGGDVDTIGAMAGAIWGAVNGLSSLPAESIAKLEHSDRLLAVAGALHAKFRALKR